MAQGAFILRTERFDELRVEHGYKSLSAFCRASGVSRSSMDDMRRGDHEPSLKNIRRILDAFQGEVGFGGLFKANPDVPSYAPDKVAA